MFKFIILNVYLMTNKSLEYEIKMYNSGDEDTSEIKWQAF